jgi:hypothetical protein
MSHNGTEAVVAVLPDCDICKYDLHKLGVPAAYDGKTNRGPWAYMCEKHFKSDGLGRLGTGIGQKLVLDKS